MRPIKEKEIVRDEIVNLNIDGLDVEELEQRLELAVTAPHLLGWGCNCYCIDPDPDCTVLTVVCRSDR